MPTANNWQDWLDALEIIRAWLAHYVFTPSLMTQIGIAAVGLVLAFYVGMYFGKWVYARFPPLDDNDFRLRRTVLRVARRQAFPLTLLLWISLSILVYKLLGEPYSALNKISSLAIAWALSRLFSAFIRNPTISHTLATLIWTVAALHILGHLPSLIAWLDSIKLSQDGISVYALVSSLFSVAFFIWLALIIANTLERHLQHNPALSASTRTLLTKVSKVLLLGIACMIGLNIVGVDLTAFAVFGGAIGVGIGLGLQKVFSNLMAGFILLLDKSIKPGDTLVVNNQYGRVNRLSARYVSISTRNGTEHLVPNDELINQRVENWSYSDPNVRLKIPLGIHYHADIRQAIALCEAAARETPRVLASPKPVCLLMGFGDNAVNLEVRMWIIDPMNGCSNVKSDTLLRIWEKFHTHDIAIPYPQRDLHLRSVDADLAQHLAKSFKNSVG